MYKKLLRTKKRPLHTISKKWRWRLNFADCPARLPVHFDSMPAFSDGIMPQKHLYPQILPTPTHVGRVWPVLTSSGVLCPVTLFLPHDPDALLHSVTVFFSVSSLLSSPSLSPSLSLHHATQFPSHATSSSRSVSTQSEVELLLLLYLLLLLLHRVPFPPTSSPPTSFSLPSPPLRLLLTRPTSFLGL